MEQKFEIGDRVVRGPDWAWGDQDGGGEGTVVEAPYSVDESGTVWVGVRWDGGHRNSYRVGPCVDLENLSRPADKTYGNEEE